MSGSDERGHFDPTQFNRLFVAQNLVGLDRGITLFVSKCEIVLTAARELFGVGRAHDQGRLCCLFQFGHAAHVVYMCVAGEQNLDVFKAKSQFGSVLFDLGHRFLKSAVEQNVTLGRCNQIGGDVRSSDIMNIADNTERFEWSVHRAVAFTLLSVRRTAKQDRQYQKEGNEYFSFHLSTDSSLCR